MNKVVTRVAFSALALVGLMAFESAAKAAQCTLDAPNAEGKRAFMCTGVNIDGIQSFDKKNGNHSLLLFRRNDLLDVARAARDSGLCKIQQLPDMQEPGIEHGSVNGVYLSEPGDVNAADASLKLAHTAFLLGAPVTIKVVAPIPGPTGLCKLGYIIMKRGL